MGARVCECESASACTSRRHCVSRSSRCGSRSRCIKLKEKKIHSWKGSCKVEAGRQLRSRGRVMAGSFSASRDWGNPRRLGFALAPRWGGAIHSGSD